MEWIPIHPVAGRVDAAVDAGHEAGRTLPLGRGKGNPSSGAEFGPPEAGKRRFHSPLPHAHSLRDNQFT